MENAVINIKSSSFMIFLITKPHFRQKMSFFRQKFTSHSIFFKFFTARLIFFYLGLTYPGLLHCDCVKNLIWLFRVNHCKEKLVNKLAHLLTTSIFFFLNLKYKTRIAHIWETNLQITFRNYFHAHLLPIVLALNLQWVKQPLRWCWLSQQNKRLV